MSYRYTRRENTSSTHADIRTRTLLPLSRRTDVECSSIDATQPLPVTGSLLSWDTTYMEHSDTTSTIYVHTTAGGGMPEGSNHRNCKATTPSAARLA